MSALRLAMVHCKPKRSSGKACITARCSTTPLRISLAETRVSVTLSLTGGSGAAEDMQNES